MAVAIATVLPSCDSQMIGWTMRWQNDGEVSEWVSGSQLNDYYHNIGRHTQDRAATCFNFDVASRPDAQLDVNSLWCAHHHWIWYSSVVVVIVVVAVDVVVGLLLFNVSVFFFRAISFSLWFVLSLLDFVVCVFFFLSLSKWPFNTQTIFPKRRFFSGFSMLYAITLKHGRVPLQIRKTYTEHWGLQHRSKSCAH